MAVKQLRLIKKNSSKSMAKAVKPFLPKTVMICVLKFSHLAILFVLVSGDGVSNLLLLKSIITVLSLLHFDVFHLKFGQQNKSG